MTLYGGESSAMEIDVSPVQRPFGGATITGGGVGLDASRQTNPNPSLNMVDISGGGYGFSFDGQPPTVLTKFKIQPMNQSLTLANSNPGQQVWNYSNTNLYLNVVRPRIQEQYLSGAYGWMDVDAMDTGTRTTMKGYVSPPIDQWANNWASTILQKDTWFLNDIGNILVTSPRAPGETNLLPAATAIYWVGGTAYCAAGSSAGITGVCANTVYQYQVTCLDGRGLETTPPLNTYNSGLGTGTPGTWVNGIFTFQISNSAPPLNGTNYNVVGWTPMRGCSAYNVYGDNGIGGSIGYLGTVNAWDNFRSPQFRDQGQYTKIAGRVPPIKSQSGIIETENGLVLDNLQNAGFLGTDSRGRTIQSPGTFPLYTPGVIYRTPNTSAVTEALGNTATSTTAQARAPGSVLQYIRFTPTIAGLTPDHCAIQTGAAAGAIRCGIYDSSGAGGVPGRLLCEDGYKGTSLSANTVSMVSPPGSCPPLVVGENYWLGFIYLAQTDTFRTAGAPAGTSYYQNIPSGNYLFPLNSGVLYSSTYWDTVSIVLSNAPTMVSGVTQGTGYLYSNGSSFSWQTGTSGGAPPLNIVKPTGNYTTTTTDDVVLINCSTACTVTVTTSGLTAKIIQIKNIGTAAVTITPVAPATVDGSTSTQLALRLQSVRLVWDGTNFWLI
jgi:hypothetical protein